MSVRTFQQRLSDEDRVLSELADEISFEVAPAMLKDTDISGAEITKRLGYRHQGDFSKAWKRRTGISPVDFRCNQRGKSRIKPHLKIGETHRSRKS